MTQAMDTPGRWTAARKEELLLEVKQGVTARADALCRHGLTDEEFASWEHRFTRRGRAGLRVYSLQDDNGRRSS